ncbi:MAG: molecular chaperone TorD family protein [Halalkalicoccus sp.]
MMTNESLTPEEILRRERRRARAYELLSACYHEPSEELLTKLEEPAVLKGTATTESLDELRIDYAKLFVGPFEVRAPPYESVYVDSESRLMTESTVSVREIYRREGLDIDLDKPADHIAAQLEFTYVLVLAQLDALESNDPERAAEYLRRQYEFLSEHLGRWVSEIAENMRDAAETEFYQLLANETQSFVEGDGKRLADRLNRLETTDDVLTVLGGETDE